MCVFFFSLELHNCKNYNERELEMKVNCSPGGFTNLVVVCFLQQ